MRRFIPYLLFAILVGFSAFYFKNLYINSTKNLPLNFLVGFDRPSSLDPLDYDYFKHHPAQSLINCTLTSLYRGQGTASPELAESWKVENGGARWIFRIRSDVTFYRTKVKVTPQIIENSMKRIFFKLKNQKTLYEFIHALEGISDLDSPSKKISGIHASDNELTFQFTKPIENLSETLSFGHFAIVSSASFSEDGNWTAVNFEVYDGCGPYFIESDKPEGINFVKRSDYPTDLTNKNGFEEIRQVFKLDVKSPPLLLRGSENAEMPASHKFYGSGNRAISYVRVMSFDQSGSPFKNVKFRIALRNQFYEELKSRGLKHSRSFFPKILTGVEEPVSPVVNEDFSADLRKNSKEKLEVAFLDSRPNANKDLTAAYAALESAIGKLQGVSIGKTGVPIEKIVKSYSEGKNLTGLDLVVLFTGISLEDPLADVRLMFSKEGIFLPDPDGTIKKELREPQPNIQFINEKIFQSAIIWPLSISSVGIWAHESLDMSDYNVLKPLGELQWIGRKE